VSHFIFSNVLPANEKQLMNGSFIVVLQTVRVPPHLLIAVNGKTWSISVSGQLPGEPLEKLFAFIHRKQVPTIFSELILPKEITEEKFCALLNDAVSRYPEVHANETTCLDPIRDAAAEVFGDSLNHTRFIFELIPAIQLNGGIGKHYGFYLEKHLDSEGNLAMPVYTAEDVAKATEEAAKLYAESRS
jgi:hypothetical protein